MITVVPSIYDVNTPGSDDDETDLCKRFDRVQKATGYRLTGQDNFSAATVIKCAKTFVWYELAYRYDTAVWTTSNFTMTSREAAYNSNCASIILLP
ncbi:hypothetical protein AAVH_23066 [Aphelenchoides avenae]|nr:hypothetical protein AAVH_23066 [Aphelenchus avenae]